MVCNLFSRWLRGTQIRLKRRTLALPWRGNQRPEELENRIVPATISVTTFADVVNPADGKISLREAISQANATPASDTIVLKAGTYSIELIGTGDDENATGDFDITAPVIIKGVGDGKTIIDGDELDRVFHITNSSEDVIAVEFQALTIRHGLTGGDISLGLESGGDYEEVLGHSGAGILVSGFMATGWTTDVAETGPVNLTLRNASVRENVATLIGGGIASFAGDVALINSIVEDNVGVLAGGGIVTIDGDVNLSGSTVAGNTVSGGAFEFLDGVPFDFTPGLGGGIVTSEGNVFLTDKSRVVENVANSEGGGIWTDNGHVTLEKDSAVRDNVAGTHGGGIHTHDGNVTINAGHVTGNFAGEDGGGIATVLGDVILTAKTNVESNSARGHGGGIATEGGNVSLTNVLVIKNVAGLEGGGIRTNLVEGEIPPQGVEGKDGNVTLVGTFVSDNVAADDGGGIDTDGGNVMVTAKSSVSRNSSGNNGGGIHTTSRSGSGRVTVTNSTIADNDCDTDGGGIATEGSGGEDGDGNVVLTSSTVTGNSAGSDGGGIDSDGADVTVTSSTISGNKALDGDGGGIDMSNNDDVFEFGGDFSTLLVEKGSSVSRNVAGDEGGGIWNDIGTVTINGSSVSDNHSEFDGGGLYSDGGDVVLIGATVARNVSGAAGGGIRTGSNSLYDPDEDDFFDVFGDVSVTRSNITDNVARAADDGEGGVFGGGGIRTSSGDVTIEDRSNVNANRSGLSGGGIDTFDGEVSVTNSTVSRNVAGGEGGGINSDEGIMTVNNSTVSRNVAAGTGGGVHTYGGEITLENKTVISDNKAADYGGGVAAGSGQQHVIVNVTDTTIKGNTAGISGGGIDVFVGVVNQTVTILRSTISGNRAAGIGGGIFSNDTTNITDSTIADNKSGGDGGGVYVTTADLTVESSTVSGNKSGGEGGGIAAFDANLMLTNVTISGNSAQQDGGGLYYGDPVEKSATLLNVTIAFNRARNGGGVSINEGDVVNVKNSIIAKNKAAAGSDSPDVQGLFNSEGNNLIGASDGSNGFEDEVDGDIVGTLAAAIDPKLGSLANNGGPTKTHKLLTGSQAINNGNNEGAPDLDQRGLQRLHDNDETVDIGAFELGAITPIRD